MPVLCHQGLREAKNCDPLVLQRKLSWIPFVGTMDVPALIVLKLSMAWSSFLLWAVKQKFCLELT